MPAQVHSAVCTTLRRDDAAPLAGEPIAVAAARDGTVLILDRAGGAAPSLLRRYRNGFEVGSPVALADKGLGLAVAAYDIALAEEDLGAVPAPLGRIYAVVRDRQPGLRLHPLGARATSCRRSRLQGYFPLRSFGGKGLASDGKHAYYDFADRIVPLAEQRRPRFVPEVVVITPTFDGGEPGCVWHRLMLDGCLPPQATVEVSSRAADDADLLEVSRWSEEPLPQRRREGSELPFVASPAEPRGTWELLFQRARGRHLQLQLRLTGDERTSPRLRALRVYYPRFSYLDRYLPKLYRRTPPRPRSWIASSRTSRGSTPPSRTASRSPQILLDPDATPAEHLAWLAGWFELAARPGLERGQAPAVPPPREPVLAAARDPARARARAAPGLR